jgi:hypothetical protein
VAGLIEFRRVADEVRNWGRWGDADELGTHNFISPGKVREAASLVKHGKVFPLGVDFSSSGPQGAFQFRHNPIHLMTVDGGDARTLVQYGRKWVRNARAAELSGFFGRGMRIRHLAGFCAALGISSAHFVGNSMARSCCSPTPPPIHRSCRCAAW